MGQWLIADFSLLDVHVQLWMMLVTGIILFRLIYVWAPRQRLPRWQREQRAARAERPFRYAAQTQDASASTRLGPGVALAFALWS